MKPPRRTAQPHLITAIGAILLAALAVSLSAWSHAEQQKQAAMAAASADLRHQAQVTGQALDMLVQAVDLAITDVAETVRGRVFSDVYNPRHFHDRLRRSLASLPQVGRIAVFDDAGELENDSRVHPPAPLSIARADLFRGHRDRWLDLSMTAPGHGVSGFDPRHLLVSRRIDDSDNAFRGVVVAEINSGYLRDTLWTSAASGIEGFAVTDLSGVVVAGFLDDLSISPPQPGTWLTTNAHFGGLPEGFGRTGGIAVHEGDGHLYAIYQLSHVPLRLVATLESHVPLEAWRQGTLVPALLLSGGSWVAALVVIAILIIQGRQTSRVRRELEDSEARLDQLVTASPAVIYGARADRGFAATSLSGNLKSVLGYEAQTVLANPTWWTDNLHPEDRDRVLADLEPWLTSGATGVYRHRYRFRAADGAWRWIEDQVVAVHGADGAIEELIGSLIDVSEAMEGAERLAKLARSVPGMIFQFRRTADGTSTFPYCSEGARDILGLEPEALAADGDQAFGLIHPDDVDRVQQAVELSRQSLSEWGSEFRINHPTLGEIWISGHANPEPQDDGSVLWHGFLSEITLRKRAQHALQRSEERLALILRGTNDAPWDWDLVADTMYYAPRWWDMLGYEVDELPGGPRLWQDLLHPEDAARMGPYVVETFADPSRDGFVIEFRLRHKDGHYVPMLSRGVILRHSDGTPYRLAGANTDLTERRALEHALADSERLYRSIFENVSDAIFLVEVGADGGFRYLRANPAHKASTGLEQFEGLRPRDFLPTPMAEQAVSHYEDCLTVGQPVIYEETLALPAGQRVWSTTLNPIRDETGGITLLVGISRDITEAKRAERVIRESEERLATYFRVAPLGIYVADAAGHYQEVNAAACAQSGFTAAELTAMTVADYVTPDFQEEARAHVARVHETGMAHGEIKLRRKDGSWFWGMVAAGPLPDGRVIGFVEDITERKRMEDSLQRSNADLEQFAYVASHDLRQPLRMVNSYLQLIGRRLGPTLDPETTEFLEYARDGARRMDQMLVALLEFSRVGRSGLPKAPVESRTVLDEALRFLGPTIAETGTEVLVDGDWPVVFASRDELVRLFQNLIDNAMKYRPADVTPRITVAVERADEGWRFLVRDNGIGIPPEQIPRLFKVFQRLHTREEFEGTGIGLAVCRKIVERHGGRIWADSDGPGTGSTFGFTLPVTVPEMAEA